jgi:hypothetical protein
MAVKTAAAAILVFAAASLFGQSVSPAAPAARPSEKPARMIEIDASSPSPHKPSPRGKDSLHEQAQEMQETLARMHAVLDQMRTKSAISKDPAAKANVEMWGLMANHLDKQLQELQSSVAARDELDARRAALYKQAEAKSAAAAHAAQAAQSAAAGATAAISPAGQGTTEPGQTSGAPAPTN